MPVPDLSNFGRIKPPEDPRDRRFAASRVLVGALLVYRSIATPVVTRTAYTWPLARRRQEYQGSEPSCVAATGKEWERARPVDQESGLSRQELYAACKQRDGRPTEDGTDARTLLQVYRSLGIVSSYHVCETALEVVEWILRFGPVWWGAWWSEAMCMTGPDGDMDAASGPFLYGHETLLIGADKKRGTVDGVNHWGLDWGKRGRFRMKIADLDDDLRNRGGDAYGVCQALRPRR